MSIWTDAGAAIARAFAEEEPVTYRGPVVVGPISAIVSNDPAGEFAGAGATLRRITYEIQKGDLPFTPRKKETLDHGSRSWRVEDITSRADVDAWQLVVTDAGPLP